MEALADFESEDLLERLGGDEDTTRRVLGIFMNDMPLQLAALAEAVGAGDSTAARRVAHTIKGAAANVGGPAVSELASRLEQLGRDNDCGAAADLLPELSVRLERMGDAIREFCGGREKAN